MSSDGDDFFSNIVPDVESLSGKGNFFENIFTDVVNAGVNYATLGSLGYSKDSGLGTKSGVISNSVGRAAVDGLKTVTGAKAAEEANTFAREQFEATKVQAEKERENIQAQTARDQIKQSQMAGAARATAASRITAKGSSATSGGGTLSLGEDEKDFLGL